MYVERMGIYLYLCIPSWSITIFSRQVKFAELGTTCSVLLKSFFPDHDLLGLSFHSKDSHTFKTDYPVIKLSFDVWH